MHDHDSDLVEDRHLARVLSLDEGHPERVAFERDPRHRALLRAFAEFERADRAFAPTEDLEGAEQTLDAALGRILHVEHAPVRPRATASGARPWRRLALAASVLLAAGAVWTMRPEVLDTGTPRGVLRGEGPAALGVSAQWNPDGTLSLRWPASPEADVYLVRVHDPALTVIATLPTDSSELTVAEDQVRALLDQRATTWSVDAMIDGDERSLHRTVVLPPVP